MNKIANNPKTKWIDQTIDEQKMMQGQSLILLNEPLRVIIKQKKNKYKNINHFYQPFAQRFKDKIFTFNKIGTMYKLNQSQSPQAKATLIFTRHRPLKNSKAKSVLKYQKNLEKVSKSSRVSIESKDTQRQTKSLDATKVVMAFAKENFQRYAPDCSQIKEQQIEETIIKKSENQNRILKSMKQKRGKQNVRRAIQFNTIQEDHEQVEKKQKFMNKLIDEKSTPDAIQVKLLSEQKLPQVKNLQSKLNRISTQAAKRRRLKNKKGEEILPKLALPNAKRAQDEQFYTIR